MSVYDIDRGNTGILKEYNENLELEKEVSVGQRIRVKHFNISEYAVADIIEVKGNSAKISITPKLIRCNVFPGDNITLVFVNDQKEECLVDGIVEKAQAEFPQYFLVRGIKIRRFKEYRKNRRYEIDACCNILEGENTSEYSNIKNISFSGCRMMTKAFIEERKNFKLEVFIKNGKKAYVDVGVVRSKKFINFYEYGLVILGMDSESRLAIGEEINEIIEKEKCRV